MVELLLSGLVLGSSSASLAGLFSSSAMQFFRTSASSTIKAKLRNGLSPFHVGYWKQYDSTEIPSNLLEILLLGPEMSKQFIATKIGISTKACGELVILPGYRDELGMTTDAVIRIDLVDPEDYERVRGKSSEGTATLTTKPVYIAASEGYMLVGGRKSTDGSSSGGGTTVELLTKFQWKIPHSGLEYLNVPHHNYEQYDYLGASADQVAQELEEIEGYPKSKYAQELASHTLRKAIAIQMTNQAVNENSSPWTAKGPTFPNFNSDECCTTSGGEEETWWASTVKKYVVADRKSVV